MRVVYWLTYFMAAIFLLGETARRGIEYFAINATTMIEDYLCGALLLVAAWVWFNGYDIASKMMAVAWAYATGGMFVPFAAHLEAWIREETFRPDHPHTDLQSVILKGMIWAICLPDRHLKISRQQEFAPLLVAGADGSGTMIVRQGIKSVGSLLLMLLVLCPRPGVAQDATQVPVFKKEEIQQLLAPIALYPDQLLAQLLMASTYPLQIVQAARWQKDNAKLAGDALDKALQRKEWDASVKSLAPFPQVLQMMSDDLEWTQTLGDAFLAQQADVMAEVQALRAKAQEAGTLKTTEQQDVTTQKQVIVIQPATPQTVYVPVYNPTVVYGGWPYPTYPPYYYPPPPGSAFVAGVFWGTAVAASAHYWGWGDCDWHGGDINIDVDRYNDISIDKNKITSREWKHNPANRGQVPYRDKKSREQFGAKANPVRASREARGFDDAAPGTMDRAKPDQRDKSTNAQKNASRDTPKREASRPAAKDKVARAPDVAKDARKTDRPAPQRRSPSPAAFDVKRGSDARAHSGRGQASRQSMARQGGRRR